MYICARGYPYKTPHPIEIYVYMYIWIYINTCLYGVHVYMHICVYVHIYTLWGEALQRCMYICIYENMKIRVCMHICIYAYMYTCIYVYTYVCIYVNIPTCIYVPLSISVKLLTLYIYRESVFTLCECVLHNRVSVYAYGAEYCLFYRALLQKRPINLRSLLIEATTYQHMHIYMYKYNIKAHVCVYCIIVYTYMYTHICTCAYTRIIYMHMCVFVA